MSSPEKNAVLPDQKEKEAVVVVEQEKEREAVLVDDQHAVGAAEEQQEEDGEPATPSRHALLSLPGKLGRRGRPVR